MSEEKNPYQTLIDNILIKLDSVEWERILIDVERINSTVQFAPFKILTNGEKKVIRLPFGQKDAKAIHDIYDFSVKFGGEKSKWNRAVFILNKDLKFDISFSWDQELQDEFGINT